jgi:hypothetical protein
MDKEEFHWNFGVMQGWFSAKLDQQPLRHNIQESTTFTHPYGSNKQHCMDKEEFHWVFGVMHGWFSFSAKLGVKNQ